MQIREWFGLAPTKDGFAQEMLALLKKADGKDWTYDAAEDAIRLGSTQVNLTNLFREYKSAARASRPALLQKYAQVAQNMNKEVPQLWTVAAKNIHVALRSRFDQTALEIQARDAENPWPKTVSRPFSDDLQVRLVYDFGEHTTHVRQELVETWGQSLDSVFQVGHENLSSLPTPIWKASRNGVFELVSEASYDESFMLVPRVFDALPFKDFALCAPCNRGVLLCADSRSSQAQIALVNEAMRCHRERPWPLSTSFFERTQQGWQAIHLSGEAGDLARDFQRMDRALIYKEQKEALEALYERQGTDLFVATMQLMRRTEGEVITSWCVWTKGVETLLPRTDLIAMNPHDESSADTITLVRWEDMEAACGHRLSPTAENPTRYLVDSFPDEKEWALISASRL